VRAKIRPPRSEFLRGLVELLLLAGIVYLFLVIP